MRQFEHTFRQEEFLGLRNDRSLSRGSFKPSSCINLIADVYGYREVPAISCPVSDVKLTNAGVLVKENVRVFLGKQFRFLCYGNKVFWIDNSFNIYPVCFKLSGDVTEQVLTEVSQNIADSNKWSLAEYGDSFVLCNGKVCFFRVSEDLGGFISPSPDDLGFVDLQVFVTDIAEPYSGMRPQIVRVFQDRLFMFGGGFVNSGLWGDLPSDCFVWSDVGATDLRQILVAKEDL